MLKEPKQFRSEKINQEIAPLPKEIAVKFVNGTLLNEAPIVHQGDKSVIRRCFEREETIPEIDHAKLHIDYRRFNEPARERPDQIRFEYTQSDPTDPKSTVPVAGMHLAITNPETFSLEHRYVQPAFRTRSGIGTRLLATTEGWIQQVAQEQERPITLVLQTGQESVIKWIQDKGYTVKEEQQGLLEEMTNHPERFFQDKVILSPESQQEGIVKDPYTFRIGTQGRYMEDAIRVTFQKTFE